MIMKKWLISVVLTVVTIVAMAQSSTLQLGGKVINSEGAPVDYATITLVPEGEEYSPAESDHRMTISNAGGEFCIEAEVGNYTLKINCVGYNFQSGKMFRAKSVESGAEEEKNRIK